MTTNYRWDEGSPYGDIVLETDGSGNVQASYTLGGTDLLAQVAALSATCCPMGKAVSGNWPTVSAK